MDFIWGIFIPFAGTSLGAAMVYLMRSKINLRLQKILLGFAAGVMIAASIWSLLIPSIEMSNDKGRFAFIPASIGFLLGVAFLLVVDLIIRKNDSKNLDKKKINKTLKMVFTITLHNIPEGMAVGVIFAGAILGDTGISIASAISLAIGIGIQNIPEGAIVSMPIKLDGKNKNRAFLCGVLSGIVEPIAAIITILLTKYLVPVLPYLLAFASGAMIHVVVEELIPESQEGDHSIFATIGVSLGFVLMMILDVAL